MAKFTTVEIAIKALGQIGPARLAENALYRAGLRLGLYPAAPPAGLGQAQLTPAALPPILPSAAGWNTLDILGEAQEVCGGQVRLFGGPPAALNLTPVGALHPWRDYELGRANWGTEDVKFTWEPARFGWAVTLARAYRIGGDERFARCFWHHLEGFVEANPAYLGPNWASGQEVGLRLICWPLRSALLPFHRKAQLNEWDCWHGRLRNTRRAFRRP